MFRPRGNAGQAKVPEAPATEDIHQPGFHSARNGVELNASITPTSRATRQTMFHPVASASRLAHHDMLQPVSQSTNNAGANHTISTQSFHRPPRFLVSARGNPEPIKASAASTSRATRPGAQIIDNIESDGTPPLPLSASAALTSRVIRPRARLIDSIDSDGTPPAAQPFGSIEPDDTPSLLAHVSAALTSHTIRPASRLGDSIESDGTPPLQANASITSTSRIIRPGARLIDSIDSDGTSSLPTSASTTSTSHIIRPASPILQSIETETPPPLPISRKTRRPMLQLLRDAGPANPEPVNIPSSSTARGSRPLPLPDRTETGRPIAPTTSTSRATYQTVPQTVSNVNAGPSRMHTASTSRISQQPTLQPTRNGMPAHASTTSASRTVVQPTIQPMRNGMPAHASTTSSSRIATQPTIQPTRTLPTQNPSASSSKIAAQPMIQPTRTLPTQNPSASSSRTSQQSAFRPLKTTAPPANTPTPSTSSSILEFICLYSHDLRRKKKRWQDGKLKFHTFNKKYVVYDDGGGFVGDGHWQGDESEFTEGVEMNLDRGMVIVQVLECTGSKEQDLGEVLGKRAREVEERRVNAAAKNPASTVVASSNPAKRIRGIAAAAAVQAAQAPTTAITTTAIPLPRGGGAWSKHAVDLLGMTRPSK
ncbi:hypothetical protein THAR02_11120 [Trichoderma harzianum]|uniref:5'-3' DNA helicase ZGRF1-like N-terminal domain-containing protein n=1 Tax=Trichoderma harzianum TaxID=5544 RepID=A0A0F9WWB7_TRIHA|nr:hypothetical protein THAR02_11120 [Trichoderma harzianum]